MHGVIFQPVGNLAKNSRKAPPASRASVQSNYCLLRHILGLKFGKPIEKVRLVYLYFDAIGDEGEEHRAELRRFQQRIAPDPIRFVPMPVQEFILHAVSRCRPEHNDYVDYLADRYL